MLQHLTRKSLKHTAIENTHSSESPCEVYSHGSVENLSRRLCPICFRRAAISTLSTSVVAEQDLALQETI